MTLTPDQAATRASQAMNQGVSATRNYATYTNPGPATLQRIDGKMWYAFQLEFDGSGNKQRLHAVVPGYILISAEDPNAAAVERYAPQFPNASMDRRVKRTLAGLEGHVGPYNRVRSVR